MARDAAPVSECLAGWRMGLDWLLWLPLLSLCFPYLCSDALVAAKNLVQKINAFHSVALHGVAEAMGKGVAL
jgi:hypothetical protein